MQAFNQLRAAARARRDRLCEHARAECEKTLAQIAALESELCGQGQLEAPKSTTSYITNVMPADRPFTSPQIVEALEASQPWRMWNKHAVDSAINMLVRKGIVKRYSKRRCGKGREIIHAAYVLAGSKVQPDDPFADVNLRDAIYRVLKGRSLTLTELSVEMLAAGYRTVMNPQNLRECLAKSLRKDARFRVVDGKWACR